MEGTSLEMRIVHANAAGIDVGSREHWVAVNQKPEDIRVFGVYHGDHEQLVSYLRQSGIETVALESTGSYWQTLYNYLDRSGFNVVLCNKIIKNPRGKTDRKDCLWIQKMHMLGLLENSFIPDALIEKMRQYSRYRSNLISDRSMVTNRINSTLLQLNLRLDVVFSDITGVSSLKIIRAILKGERNKEALLDLVTGNVKRSRSEIAMALCGNFREELLFQLNGHLNQYDYLEKLIADVENKIEIELKSQSASPNYDEAYVPTKKRIQKGQCKINISQLSYRYYGVDLMAVEGLSHNTLLTLLTEVGSDIYKFPTSKHFTSWLRVSPNNKISGGKILKNKTPKGANRLALALRNAANTIGQCKEGVLRKFFARIAFKKGRAAAITATARKLAIIIWNMIMKNEEYQPDKEQQYDNRIREIIIKNIKRKITQNNLTVEELDLIWAKSSG